MSCAPVSKRISTRASDSCGSACRIVTVSRTSECATVRDFAPYQRCLVTYSITDRSSISLHLLFLPELEPEEPARRERQEVGRSEEHTSELQSHVNLVCRLLLEKKKKIDIKMSRLTINNI